MAVWTPVAKIAGVTIAAVYQTFATSPPWPSSGTTAVLGTDYSVNATTGKITILRSFSGLGGWMRFTFSDAGGTIAGTPEYPAISARLTTDITACASGTFHYDHASRLSTTVTDQITTNPQTQTGITYDGTGFSIAMGSDGSFSSSDPQGATLLLELNLTISVTPAAFWTDRVNCTEFDS